MENTSSNTYLTTNTSNFLNQSATLQMEFGQPEESLQAMGLMAQVHITSAYQSGVPVSFCNSGYITSGKHDLPKVWVNEEVHNCIYITSFFVFVFYAYYCVMGTSINFSFCSSYGFLELTSISTYIDIYYS